MVCAHRSAKMLGGSEANFWRLTCATIFLALWAHGFGQGLSSIAFPTFLMSGIIGIGIGDVALFQALPCLGSRLTTLLIQCLSSPFAALIEYLWLGTKLTALQMVCGAVVLGGVSVALSPGKHLKLSREKLTVGVAFGVIAALGNACGAVLSRKGFGQVAAAGQHLDGGTSAYQRLIGGLFIAAVFVLIARRKKIQLTETKPSGEKIKAWPWVLSNALAGQTLGVSCYQVALKSAPTGVVLPVVALTPLVVIPFAHYFENERPSKRSLVGGVIAVLGVIGLMLLKH